MSGHIISVIEPTGKAGDLLDRWSHRHVGNCDADSVSRHGGRVIIVSIDMFVGDDSDPEQLEDEEFECGSDFTFKPTSVRPSNYPREIRSRRNRPYKEE